MIPAFWPSMVSIIAGTLLGETMMVGQSTTRLVVRDEVVWRVPLLPRPMPHEFVWIERKGPKCVPISAIRRAMLSGSGNIDFILANRQRIRAKFDDRCPALDFYAGLYLLPEDEDEMLCANRDSVHSRVGGSCQIEHFRLLKRKLRG